MYGLKGQSFGSALFLYPAIGLFVKALLKALENMSVFLTQQNHGFGSFLTQYE
jgi:hypothetical protein